MNLINRSRRPLPNPRRKSERKNESFLVSAETRPKFVGLLFGLVFFRTTEYTNTSHQKFFFGKICVTKFSLREDICF